MTTVLQSRYTNTQVPQTPFSISFSEDGYLAVSAGTSLTLYSVSTQSGGLARSVEFLRPAHVAYVGTPDEDEERNLFCSSLGSMGDQLGERLAHIASATFGSAGKSAKAKREHYYEDSTFFVSVEWSPADASGACRLATVSNRGLVQILTYPRNHTLSALDCTPLSKPSISPNLQSLDPVCTAWHPSSSIHPLENCQMMLAVGCKKKGSIVVVSLNMESSSSVPADFNCVASLEVGTDGEWITALCWVCSLTNIEKVNTSYILAGTSLGRVIVVEFERKGEAVSLTEVSTVFSKSRCLPVSSIKNLDDAFLVVKGRESIVFQFPAQDGPTQDSDEPKQIQVTRQVTGASLVRKCGRIYLSVCDYEGNLEIREVFKKQNFGIVNQQSHPNSVRAIGLRISAQNVAKDWFRDGDKPSIKSTPLAVRSELDDGFCPTFGCAISRNTTLVLFFHLETELRHLYQGRLRRPLSMIVMRSVSSSQKDHLEQMINTVAEIAVKTGRVDTSDVVFAITEELIRLNGSPEDELNFVKLLDEKVRLLLLKPVTANGSEIVRSSNWIRAQCATSILEGVETRSSVETLEISKRWQEIVLRQRIYALLLWNTTCLKLLMQVPPMQVHILPGLKEAALYHADLALCAVTASGEKKEKLKEYCVRFAGDYPSFDILELEETVSAVYRLFGEESDVSRLRNRESAPPSRLKHQLLGEDPERIGLPTFNNPSHPHEWDSAFGLSHSVGALQIPRSCISLRLLLFSPSKRCLNCGVFCESDNLTLTLFLSGRTKLTGELKEKPLLPQNTCPICYGRFAPVDAFNTPHPAKRPKLIKEN